MTENTTDADDEDVWAPDTLRSLLPNSLGSEGTRAAICAIRNPDASTVQIAEKCGLASNYTVGNALRSLLVGAHEDGENAAGAAEALELRGGAREAEQYGELTEKQRAVIDFAAECPEFTESRTYGEVSQAIQQREDVAVGETYVGRVLRLYPEILHRRRALAAENGDSDADLEDVTSDLTVREMLEAAGYDLPDENLDQMPDVEQNTSATDAETGQVTLRQAQESEAGFQRASEQHDTQADEEPDGLTWLEDAWCEAHADLPGAENAVRLPMDAVEDDVKENTPYWAYVNGTAAYGVFVSLTRPPAPIDDVSGLVHDDRLYGSPSEYEKGDPMVVELEARNPQGLGFTDWRISHPDEADEDVEQAAGAPPEEDGQADEDEPVALVGESAVRLVERVEELEHAVDTLREDTVFASEMREFGTEVEDRLDGLASRVDQVEGAQADTVEEALRQADDALDGDLATKEELAGLSSRLDERITELREEVRDTLQNSVKADVVDQVEQHADTLATLQEMVNGLAEKVQRQERYQGTLGRARQAINRLERQDAEVLEYQYSERDGGVVLRLEADVPGITEDRPRCSNCGSVLGEAWREAEREAKANGHHPADCPECGENPLPPVGGSVRTPVQKQQEDTDD